MTSTTNRRRLVATALVLTSLVLGACGDDDDGGGSGSTTSADDGNAVAIEDFTFKPGDLEVAAGTTVTFTNEDGFAHTATAKDPAAKAGGFDSGNLEQDAVFEHTFEEAGTYEYLCAIHNSMTGTITVT